jgi:ubiquinol-cytochrome c reductase cytochrome c subunit
MSRAGLILLATLALAAPAHAQPKEGIVRPADERGIPLLELGRQLFAGNCVSCHGTAGRGVLLQNRQPGAGLTEGLGPPLRGVGALAADFYLRTGRMPLGNPYDAPERRRPLFSPREIEALRAYVASLGKGPGIPHPRPERGDLHEGLSLFTEHCAGCHQVVARGGVVTGARVPPLEGSTPVQIAEAVRLGPYLMPRFTDKDISDAELNSIIAYVERSKHPEDRGGWGIGNVGPIPEGMVAWFVAASAFVMLCLVIGQRRRA